MSNLTLQERRIILFLMAMALLGIGINFALKVNSSLAGVFKADERISKINLNQACLEDLLNTAAITPKLAANIIAYRNTIGAFRDIEQLKEVKGIGDYRYEKLRGLFYVE